MPRRQELSDRKTKRSPGKMQTIWRAARLPTLALAAALVIAIGLGGVGYAAGPVINATTSHARHRARPLGARAVEVLIARYYAAHSAKLHGPAGAQGTAGAAGLAGAAGPSGPAGLAGIAGHTGAPGPTTTQAPAGSTQTGIIGIQAYQVAGQPLGASITFPLALGSAPIVDEIQSFPGSDSHCHGTADAPTAPPGYLCIYMRETDNASQTAGDYLYPQILDASASEGAGPSGALITARATSTGTVTADAAWAVTAQ